MREVSIPHCALPTLSRSLHKRPVEPRWLADSGRIKEQIGAGRQIGQGKQIHPVGARQIGVVLHLEALDWRLLRWQD